MLAVPLGFINARGERARLTSKVERDAVTIASLAESTVDGEASTSNLPALKALGTRYAADTGARVVITDRRGVALVDPSPSGPGRVASRRDRSSRPRSGATTRRGSAARRRSATTCSTWQSRSPRAASFTARSVSRTRPRELDRRVRNYWLALAGIAVVVLAAVTLSACGLPAGFVARSRVSSSLRRTPGREISASARWCRTGQPRSAS